MTTCDLLLHGGSFIDVEAARIVRADVCIHGGRIQAILARGAQAPRARRTLDVTGRLVAPGFMDGHLHIESSLLRPLEFARAAVLHGTTAAFVDPHEIANVQGRRGVDLFLADAARAPMDLFIGVPSCVPATSLEDTGAALPLEEVVALLDNPQVYGLAEMMNVQAIVQGLGEARAKVNATLDHGKQADAHAPGLSGPELRAYVTNGQNDGVARIILDHECRSAAEALEKLGLGMHVALRHGSASKDLPAVLPGLLAARPGLDGVMLCSDDLDAAELAADGHMERAVRAARQVLLDAGEEPERATCRAIALATEHTAQHFAPFFGGTGRPLPGAIAPERAANLVVLRSLESLAVEAVVHAGRVVVEHGRLTAEGEAPPPPHEGNDWRPHPLSVARRLTPMDFAIRSNNGGQAQVRVIAPASDLWTRALQRPLAVAGGAVQIDAETAKLAVVERHHATGTFAVGLVERLLREGAIASTVAHDSHNIIAMGVDDAALARAVNHLATHGGGMVVVGGGVEYFPLEIGGLMSAAPLRQVVAGYGRLREALHHIGAEPDLFVRMSFLALPVIPELRLTNRGLVDVEAMDFVPVCA